MNCAALSASITLNGAVSNTLRIFNWSVSIPQGKNSFQ